MMPIGTSGPRGKGMKPSTLRDMRSRSRSQEAEIRQKMPLGKISRELSNEF